jgi:uncharacterized protein
VATSNLLNKKVVLPVIVLAVALALVWVFTAGGGVSKAAEGADLTGALINTIVVSGMGQATAMPDKATINVSVQNDAATSAEALDANSKDMQKVLDRLKSEGIASKDIETANVAVYPNYTYDDKTGQQTLAGYRAENSVTVTFTDLTLIGKIYAAVVEAGADTVYGPSWELTDNNSAVAAALSQALANAKSKAQAIAADQGVKLGDALIISESSSSQAFPIYERSESATDLGSGVTPPTIAPQSMDVSASVTITYRMTH